MTSNTDTSNTDTSNTDTSNTQEFMSEFKGSHTDLFTLISAWDNDKTITTNQRQAMRQWRIDNTVQWCLNKAKTSALTILRLPGTLVSKANSNYINSGYEFVRLFVIAKRYHDTNKDGNKVVKSQVWATIGYTTDNEFVLVSNAKFTLKTRTNNGSDLETLERSIAVVTKAIEFAKKYGTYSTTHMSKIDDMLPLHTADKPAIKKQASDNTEIL